MQAARNWKKSALVPSKAHDLAGKRPREQGGWTPRRKGRNAAPRAMAKSTGWATLPTQHGLEPCLGMAWGMAGGVAWG
eukprot:10458398-Alexandrium_andersonii.AAC.1